MSETKHTPGPWHQESEINPDGSDFFLVDKDYRTIADLRLPANDGANVPIEEAEANARLIAASPELLDGTKAVIAFQHQLWEEQLPNIPRFYDWLTPSYRLLHDAIAKAVE